MYKLVLIRHGESTWNKENRFTGWTDVDLSEKGCAWRAIEAGQVLKSLGYVFDSGLHVAAEARHQDLQRGLPRNSTRCGSRWSGRGG